MPIFAWVSSSIASCDQHGRRWAGVPCWWWLPLSLILDAIGSVAPKAAWSNNLSQSLCNLHLDVDDPLHEHLRLQKALRTYSGWCPKKLHFEALMRSACSCSAP